MKFKGIIISFYYVLIFFISLHFGFAQYDFEFYDGVFVDDNQNDLIDRLVVGFNYSINQTQAFEFDFLFEDLNQDLIFRINEEVILSEDLNFVVFNFSSDFFVESEVDGPYFLKVVEIRNESERVDFLFDVFESGFFEIEHFEGYEEYDLVALNIEYDDDKKLVSCDFINEANSSIFSFLARVEDDNFEKVYEKYFEVLEEGDIESFEFEYNESFDNLYFFVDSGDDIFELNESNNVLALYEEEFVFEDESESFNDSVNSVSTSSSSSSSSSRNGDYKEKVVYESFNFSLNNQSEVYEINESFLISNYEEKGFVYNRADIEKRLIESVFLEENHFYYDYDVRKLEVLMSNIECVSYVVFSFFVCVIFFKIFLHKKFKKMKNR